MIITCIVCGKSKYRKLCRQQRRKVCSHKCYSETLKGKPSRSLTKFKRNHVPWNKGKKWPIEIRKKMSVWKGKYGKGTPNWKGGRVQLRTKIRNSKRYKLWRTTIFDRDNYTCQFCGIRGGSLQVDHIKPFYLILSDNQITTMKKALECHELWDLANGRTLCVPCHKTTPTYLLNQHTA